VLHAPVQGRAPGRPRKTRIRSSAKSIGLGPRKRKHERCEGLGHIVRNCKNAVDPAFREDQHWGAENALQTLPKPSTIGSVPLAEPSTVALLSQAEPSIVALLAQAEPSTIALVPQAEPSTVALVPQAEPSTVTIVTQVEPSIVAIVSEAWYYSFARSVLL
jgi:hypothetical protein